MIAGTIVLAVVALLVAAIVIVSFPKVMQQRRRDLAGKGNLTVDIHVDFDAFLAEMERWLVAFKRIETAAEDATVEMTRLGNAIETADEATR